MNFKTYFRLLFPIVVVFGLIAFALYQYMLNISKPFPDHAKADMPEMQAPKDTIKVGVISRFPSNILYQGYQPLMDYLSANTDYYFELKISRDYLNAVNLLTERTVDMAFLGSYIYTVARNTYDIKPILKPLNENREPFFKSSLIVREDSGIYSIADLKGKRLALPSEQSYSGNWLLGYGLQEYNLTSEEISEIAFFDHHHYVVYEVMRKNFDAGSVKDRVALEFRQRGLRIVAESVPVPGSPLVVSANANPHIVDLVRSVLVQIDPEKPEYQEIMKNWDREFMFGFTLAQASDYDVLEQLIQGYRDL